MNLDKFSISVINFNYGQRLKGGKEVSSESKVAGKNAEWWNKINENLKYSSSVMIG